VDFPAINRQVDKHAIHLDAWLGLSCFVGEIEFLIENPGAVQLLDGENGFVFFNYILLGFGQLDLLQVARFVI
jgi:hypothetical protein